MVRQWKVACHQFQGTSIRQVVLLDTMDQLAQVQPRRVNLQSLTCLEFYNSSITDLKSQEIYRIVSRPQTGKETDLQGK